MSIDTLLEAARYLEWQAQQQQIAREEEEKRVSALAAREAEQQQQQQLLRRAVETGPSLMPTPLQVNHVSWGVEPQRIHQTQPHPQPHTAHLSPMQTSSLPTPLPITVIPIPMVQANAAAQTLSTIAAATPSHLHAVGPVPVVAPLATALSPQPAPLLSCPSSSPAALAVAGVASRAKDSSSPPCQRHLVAAVKTEDGSQTAAGSSPKQEPREQPHQLPHPHPPPPPQQTQLQPPPPAGPGSLVQPAHLLQPYTGPVITTSQHALLPQSALAQQSHTQPGQAMARPNGAALEDVRSIDGKRRPGGAGTREVHNKLEKNRRAHLKECFETLKRNVPNVDEKKTSNLSVLRSALRYIQTLKRKEKEYEHEMERLAREKIATQQRLAELKNELSQSMDVLEIDRLLRQSGQPDDDQASTSTASEGEDNFDQDVDSEMQSAPSSVLPKPPPTPLAAEPRPTLMAPTLLPAQPHPHPHPPPSAPQHITIQPHKLAAAAVTLSSLPAAIAVPSSSSSSSSSQPQMVVTPQAIAPAPSPVTPVSVSSTHVVMPQHPHPPQQQTTVIAHASVSHASVIQAVNHVPVNHVPVNHVPVIPAGSKHLAHIAPSGPAPGQQPVVGQPVGHITVHPVTHLGQHLPALYPQSVAVSQPAVVGHIAHALTAAAAAAASTHHPSHPLHHHHHHHAPVVNGTGPVVNGPAPQAATAAVMGKPTTVVAHHHPQLVGQTVLNPVTMVTMPQFPVSTLKLA